MALNAAISTATGITDTVSSGWDFLSGASAKQKRRDSYRNYLYAQGVNTFGTHYNREAELKEVVQYVSEIGQPAVQVINDVIRRNRAGNGNLEKPDYAIILNELRSLQIDLETQSNDYTNTSEAPAMIGARQMQPELFRPKNIGLMIASGIALIGGYFLLIPKGKR